MSLDLVQTINEIMENTETIDLYLKDPRLRPFAIDLVKKGTYYLAVEKNKELRFYPSRFIGYKQNTRDKHIQNRDKDVRDTNKRISAILGQELKKSADLEAEFKKFCDRVGFAPTRTGAYGLPRKFWRI